MSEIRGDVKRWTAKRRTALVLEILRGKTTASEASRQHGLKVSEIEDWRQKFLAGAENALRSRPRGERRPVSRRSRTG
jgi:transposase-like protein